MPYSPAQVLAKIIQETTIDVRLRNAKVLNWLASRGRVRAANRSELNWNVVVNPSATATSAMSVAGTDQTTGDTVQAQLTIGGFKVYHQFSLSRVDMKDAQSRGTSELKKLFEFHIKAGMLAIKRQLNNYIWNADGSAANAGMVGLMRVLDNTLPYGGIDPVTYPTWVTIKNSNATPRPLSKIILMDFHRVQEEQEVMYDAIFTNPTTSQSYNTLFDTTAGNYQLNYNANKNLVDMAPGLRHYDGVPIQTDTFCPAGSIVTFDTDNIELLSFDLTDATQGQLDSLGLFDQFTAMASAEIDGLMVNVALLPQVNPGIITFQLLVVPQLRVQNRRMLQAITNLT
jgi:hypothetical protein